MLTCRACQTRPPRGGHHCPRCQDIIQAIDNQTLPPTISKQTIADLRAAAKNADIDEPIPFEDCQSRLWDGVPCHERWAIGNSPGLYEPRKKPAKCFACGETLTDLFIQFRVPKAVNAANWSTITIHLEDCSFVR